MRHRIFIAVNLPENIKNKLIKCREKWPDLPVRWTKKENLHITLIFLGCLSEEELLEVCGAVRRAASQNSSFLITLKKICYGPPGKIPARMIWIEGEKSEGLGKLQNELESSLSLFNLLAEAGKAKTEVLPQKNVNYKSRVYAPHITLGRIRTWEFRKIEPEERPEINEEINLSFEINSIEVMESELKRGGPEYTILESAALS